MPADSKLTLVIDAKNRAKRVVSNVKRQMKGLADDVRSNFQRAGRSLQNFGSRLSEVGRGMSTFITGPLIGAGAAAVKMASDAQESENLFRKSVEGMREEAEAFVESWTEATQLDPIATKERLGIFNQMISNMGISSDRALEMSKNLTRLTVDMASFFNIPFDRAFTKLQSGLSGEMEALRRLGINVSQARIEQVALREGLIETGEEMTQQQKIVARYLAVMEQTEDIQGDFVDTQDQLANRLRQLKDQFKVAARELGKELVPAAEDALTVAKEMVRWFANLDSETRKNIVRFGAISAAVGPFALVLGQLSQVLGLVLNNLGKLRTAFGFLSGPAGVFAAVAVGVGILTEKLGDLERQTSEAVDVMLDLRDVSRSQVEAELAEITAQTSALEARQRELRERLDIPTLQVSAEEAGLEGVAGQVSVPSRELTDEEKRLMEEMRRNREELARLRQQRQRLSYALAEQAGQLESAARGGGGGGSGGPISVPGPGPVPSLRETPPGLRGGGGRVPTVADGLVSAAEQVQMRFQLMARSAREDLTSVISRFKEMGFTAREIAQGLDLPVEQVRKQFKELNSVTQAASQALRSALIDTFTALGKNLGEVFAGIGDGFQNFGQTIKRIIGSLLKTIGRALIAFGIAGESIKNFITNPALAIAAGVALTALGSALAQSAQQSVRSAGQAVASGGGMAAAAAGAGAASAAQAGTGARSRGTLQVVIEGGILDMSDPRQARQFRRAMEDVTGRDVVIMGEGSSG